MHKHIFLFASFFCIFTNTAYSMEQEQEDAAIQFYFDKLQNNPQDMNLILQFFEKTVPSVPDTTANRSLSLKRKRSNNKKPLAKKQKTAIMHRQDKRDAAQHDISIQPFQMPESTEPVSIVDIGKAATLFFDQYEGAAFHKGFNETDQEYEIFVNGCKTIFNLLEPYYQKKVLNAHHMGVFVKAAYYGEQIDARDKKPVPSEIRQSALSNTHFKAKLFCHTDDPCMYHYLFLTIPMIKNIEKFILFIKHREHRDALQPAGWDRLYTLGLGFIQGNTGTIPDLPIPKNIGKMDPSKELYKQTWTTTQLYFYELLCASQSSHKDSDETKENARTLYKNIYINGKTNTSKQIKHFLKNTTWYCYDKRDMSATIKEYIATIDN